MSAQLFGSFGKGLGNIGWGDVSIIGVVYPSQQVGVGPHQRPQVYRLFRSENLSTYSLRLSNRSIVQIFIHAIGRFGNA